MWPIYLAPTARMYRNIKVWYCIYNLSLDSFSVAGINLSNRRFPPAICCNARMSIHGVARWRKEEGETNDFPGGERSADSKSAPGKRPHHRFSADVTSSGPEPFKILRSFPFWSAEPDARPPRLLDPLVCSSPASGNSPISSSNLHLLYAVSHAHGLVRSGSHYPFPSRARIRLPEPAGLR